MGPRGGDVRLDVRRLRNSEAAESIAAGGGVQIEIVEGK